MIRFIRLDKEDTGHNFAWFNTVSDHFEEHSTYMAWNFWQEFEADYQGDDLERYRSLFQELPLIRGTSVKCIDLLKEGKL